MAWRLTRARTERRRRDGNQTVRPRPAEGPRSLQDKSGNSLSKAPVTTAVAGGNPASPCSPQRPASDPLRTLAAGVSSVVAPIRAGYAPPTPSGRLAHSRVRPFLIIDSGWPTNPHELNVDNTLLLPCAEGRVLSRIELMLPSRLWAGERLSEPFPETAKPGSLVFTEASVAQAYFPNPVRVVAADAKSRIRIILDDRSATQLVALSSHCVARLDAGELLGFDVRAFR